MEQLILHLFGDYLTQSDWMAQNKTKAAWPAMVHAFVYGVPFFVLAWHSPNLHWAMFTIIFSHFLIDRYRLARYVVWAKNWLGPKKAWYFEDAGGGVDGYGFPLGFWTDVDRGKVERSGNWPTAPWWGCRGTGYPPGRPEWLCFWLLIIADNTLHLAINYAALRWL